MGMFTKNDMTCLGNRPSWKRSPKLEMVGSCLRGIWTSTGAAHPKMALQAERAARDKKNRQDEVVAQLKMYVDLQHKLDSSNYRCYSR